MWYIYYRIASKFENKNLYPYSFSKGFGISIENLLIFYWCLSPDSSQMEKNKKSKSFQNLFIQILK